MYLQIWTLALLILGICLNCVIIYSIAREKPDRRGQRRIDPLGGRRPRKSRTSGQSETPPLPLDDGEQRNRLSE